MRVCCERRASKLMKSFSLSFSNSVAWLIEGSSMLVRKSYWTATGFGRGRTGWFCWMGAGASKSSKLKSVLGAGLGRTTMGAEGFWAGRGSDATLRRA